MITNRLKVPNRRIAIFLLMLFTGCVFGIGYLYFGPLYTVWRNVPGGKALRHQEVLQDRLLIGRTRDGIRAILGDTSRISGPYSWWSLLDKPPDGELSALAFHYDKYLNITRIALRESTSEETNAAPLPLSLEKYREEAPRVRHQIHLAIASLSEQGRLPSELATIRDVEKFFPKARFVENWYYFASFSAGSIVVGFDSDGKVQDIWNDW